MSLLETAAYRTKAVPEALSMGDGDAPSGVLVFFRDVQSIYSVDPRKDGADRMLRLLQDALGRCSVEVDLDPRTSSILDVRACHA